MDIFKLATERRELSNLNLTMSRRFRAGTLTIGTPGEPPEDGQILAAQYYRRTVEARHSAMLLRRIALARVAK